VSRKFSLAGLSGGADVGWRATMLADASEGLLCQRERPSRSTSWRTAISAFRDHGRGARLPERHGWTSSWCWPGAPRSARWPGRRLELKCRRTGCSFAGGGGSVRGYAYRGIGVNNPDGTVSGGRYLLEASAEARYKVTGDIGVVGFVDGGYVAADSFPGLDQLRIGAGIGLRYYTSLGPLRADIAIPLNKQDGDPDYAIYVGIGQAF
jgi:hypothetical protein